MHGGVAASATARWYDWWMLYRRPLSIADRVFAGIIFFLVALAISAVELGCASSGPSASEVKAPLQKADAFVRLACMGLAQAVAAKTGAQAQEIISKTCDVENVTRTMREMILSQQLDAARAQGVLVPDINSGALEDAVPEEQNAE